LPELASSTGQLLFFVAIDHTTVSREALGVIGTIVIMLG